MNKIQFKVIFDENISLAKSVSVEYDDRTTKNIAVKPNRHSLAIFTPTHSTGVNASLLSTDNVLTVYGGLIEPNKIPFLGTKFSPLCWIVETRQPFLWLVNLTKNIGTAMFNTILAKLSHFTPAESLVLGLIIGLPMACLVVGILFAMGV